MTEEMRTLLEQLKEAATDENERKIVEECRKRLEGEDTVEIIDENHQRFNGVVYKKTGRGGRFQGFVMLHKAVYEYYYGEIPDGYEIHHKDCNPANNAIDNLEMLTRSAHHALHREKRRREYVCDFCGKTIFKSDVKKDNEHHFCDEKCKVKWRNRNGRNDVECECVICGQKYRARRRGKNTRKTCSPECHSALMSRRMQNLGQYQNSVMVEYKGELVTLSEAARRSGLSYGALRNRLKRGVTGEEAGARKSRRGNAHYENGRGTSPHHTPSGAQAHRENYRLAMGG